LDRECKLGLKQKPQTIGGVGVGLGVGEIEGEGDTEGDGEGDTEGEALGVGEVKPGGSPMAVGVTTGTSPDAFAEAAPASPTITASTQEIAIADSRIGRLELNSRLGWDIVKP
jgi:hypothetical protein